MLPRGADSAWAPAALVSVLLLPFDVAEVHDRSVVPPEEEVIYLTSQN